MLGIRRSSETSSSQAGSMLATARTLSTPLEPRDRLKPVPLLRLSDVAQLLRVGERAQLLQALVLDLPDSLARDVERAADLVERSGVLAVQPVAKLEHPALPL